MKKIINFLASLYNPIEKYWESESNHKILGTGIVLSFLISLLLIQLNKWGFLPEFIGHYISHNYFIAIEIAFIVLLFFEVMSLVFTLPYSVAKSLHKQFEIIALILLRNAFKEFSNFTEPIDWVNNYDTILQIFSDSFSALFVFAGIYFIRLIRMHRQITVDEEEQKRFIQIKKATSLILMFAFFFIALQDAYLFINHEVTYNFFPAFYTILIFSDILMVLVSLRYSYNFLVLFRNSGFALATVLLRLALNAPVYYNGVIAIIAVIFVYFLTLIYQQMIKKGFYQSKELKNDLS